MYIILSNILQNAPCTILCTGCALAAKQIRCQSLMLSFTSNHHLRNTDERDNLGNALLECEKYIYQKLRNIVLQNHHKCSLFLARPNYCMNKRIQQEYGDRLCLVKDCDKNMSEENSNTRPGKGGSVWGMREESWLVVCFGQQLLQSYGKGKAHRKKKKEKKLTDVSFALTPTYVQ